jgi:hypothetical protein
MGDALENRCPDHSDPFECPDALVCCSLGRGYGLIIYDGGSSFVDIAFCPWCGTKIGQPRPAVRSDRRHFEER